MNAGRPSGTRLHWWWVGGAALVLSLAIVLGVMVGPIAIAPFDIIRSLLDKLPLVDIDTGLTDRSEAILWEIRMPRVVLAVLVGSMLSAAGAGYQGVFRNPLADPYLLGAGAGAGLGATIAIAYGPATSGWFVDPLPLAAFVGAIGGVALAYVLDVLAVGDTEAGTLGVRPGRIRLVFVVLATMGTAAVVSVSGLIGFVGIIVPHTVRLLTSASYRVVVPLSVLLGGAFLVLADIIARVAATPAEIPIGVVTAIIGAPFFAVVLRTSRGVVS